MNPVRLGINGAAAAFDEGVVKVGTLDYPKQFTPKAAIYTIDKQAFHQIPDGMPCFERLPARG